MPPDDSRQPVQLPLRWHEPESVSAAIPDHLQWWRCPQCGQTQFTPLAERPDGFCDYCKDMTTWQPLEAPSI